MTAMSLSSFADEPAEPGDVAATAPAPARRARSARLRRSPSLWAPDSAGTSEREATAASDDRGGEQRSCRGATWQGGGRKAAKLAAGSPNCGRRVAARATLCACPSPRRRTRARRRRAAARRARGARHPAVRRLRPRAVLRGALRLLRLQHLRPGRAPAPSAAATSAPCSPSRRSRARVLGDAPPGDTVFFGGGTPTLLAPAELARDARRDPRVRPGARRRGHRRGEPGDASTRAMLAALRAAGVTRVSLGMQSASPHVLAALDRVHTPGAPPRPPRARAPPASSTSAST